MSKGNKEKNQRIQSWIGKSNGLQWVNKVYNGIYTKCSILAIW